MGTSFVVGGRNNRYRGGLVPPLDAGRRDAQVPVAVIYICAALLFLGAMPLPYGYYTLLRLVACGVFAFAAFVAHERKDQVLPWLYGLVALLFNPIIKIHLPKEAWVFVDISAGALLLVTAKTIRTPKK